MEAMGVNGSRFRNYPQAEYPAETAAAVLELSTGLEPAPGEVTTIAE
jgi:hypothetical protein